MSVTQRRLLIVPTNITSTTRRLIRTLYGDGQPNKAVLASLRTAYELSSPQAQPVWPLLLGNLDTNDLSRNGRPTHAETAIYTALHLYALHQQGHDAIVDGAAYGDDATGRTLFGVLAQLRQRPDSQVALDRRIQPLLASTNFKSVVNALTHIVSIIKGQTSTPIDYAALAQDFYWFQASYESANRVRLRWGEAYYRTGQPSQPAEGK